MIHYKPFSFVILKYFLYLCIINSNKLIMEKMIRTFGRTELALQYFPKLCPEAAWHKLRQWITINPVLSHLRDLRRRSFTPAEVELIFTQLGEP